MTWTYIRSNRRKAPQNRLPRYRRHNAPNCCPAANQTTQSKGVEKEKIAIYIFHQASKVVLDNLQRVLEIPDDKMYSDIRDIGNTVSSSIPIALKNADMNSTIAHEELILISGFGVGLSWGTCLLTWNKLL